MNTRPMDLEFKDKSAAIVYALNVLVDALIALPRCEETARTFATNTRLRLDMEGLSEAELVDRLHQCAADFAANRRS